VTTLATEPPAQRNDALQTVRVADAAPEEARLAELFRLWLRDGHVHPLIHLIRLFNSERRT
jgi:hypothetical protein